MEKEPAEVKQKSISKNERNWNDDEDIDEEEGDLEIGERKSEHFEEQDEV